MPDLVTDTELADQVIGWAALPAGQRAVLISAASRAVETYCRRTFSATDFDERYSSDMTGRLFLRNRPVISITSITLGTKDNTSPTVLDPSGYDYDEQTAEVVVGAAGDPFWPAYGGSWGGGGGYGSSLGMGWPGGGRFRDVRVVYRAGYEPADMPADVRLATILVVRSLLGGVARNPAVSSESQGGRSVSYMSASQQVLMGGGLIQDLLNQWRVYR